MAVPAAQDEFPDLPAAISDRSFSSVHFLSYWLGDLQLRPVSLGGLLEDAEGPLSSCRMKIHAGVRKFCWQSYKFT